MKKAFVLCAIVGAAVYAATAMSASGPTPVEKSLQKDVATLKSQVKKLQTQVKTANNDINTVGSLAATALLFTICGDELTADALQGTWQTVDQIATAAGQAAKFGPQTPIIATLQGQDICAAGGVTRSPSTSGAVPTIGGYQALLASFHSYKLQTLLEHARLALRH
jgi:hypothetical protein